MSKKVFILLLLLICFFSCKSIRKVRIHSKVNQPAIIYIKSEYSPDIKINGKFLVIPDQTDDKAKQEPVAPEIDAASLTKEDSKDTTSDSTDVYIRDPETIAFYKNYERLFNEYILDNLSTSLKNDNLNIEVYNYTWMKEKSGSFYIIITVSLYNEGEYNMIENVDTRMDLFINCYEGSTLTAEILKSYIIKTGIGYPLERQRLNQLSMDVAGDLTKLFKTKLFLKGRL